ncbi:MAG: hypothetical protein KUG79_10725 [Pseudomonadales bacterium]|nr:hypothetical protein [Pseudomonadales bacterium]
MEADGMEGAGLDVGEGAGNDGDEPWPGAGLPGGAGFDVGLDAGPEAGEEDGSEEDDEDELGLLQAPRLSNSINVVIHSRRLLILNLGIFSRFCKLGIFRALKSII